MDLIDQGFGATVQSWFERLENWGAPVRPARLRPRLLPAVRPWSRLLSRRPAATRNLDRRTAQPQGPATQPQGPDTQPEARTTQPATDPLVPAPCATAATQTELERAEQVAPVPAAPVDGAVPARSGLAVRLLGELSAEIDGVAVTRWSGHRGRSVFRYLVAYRHHVVPRDVLVDVFWPDAAPELGRNRLHVTLHALRADLRTASERPVIVHRDGGFQLHPDLHVWVDREAFEELLARGCAAERDRDEPTALHTYQQALALYRGDFLEDSPYEEWAVLERETLRIGHLDLLDRLGHLRAGYSGLRHLR